MLKIKPTIMVLGIFIAVFFQIAPQILGKKFIFITVLSTIPIYVISKLHPKIGIFSLIAAGLLVMLINVSESIIFFFANGAVGISLGISSYYFERREIITILSGIYLTISLSILYYAFKVPVFGNIVPSSLIIQFLILMCFSLVYSFMYFNLLQYIFDFLVSKKLLS